nr:transposase, Ptta/En/Spm, transposase, Tnp1/En/Spm-like protein [Tanacetum cinerariifolium]
RANVTAIEESKDLTSLSLDELTRNLKVHKLIIKKDSKIVKAKGERKYLALKAKKESSDEEWLTSKSEDEERSKEAEMIRTTKVIGSALDAVIRTTYWRMSEITEGKETKSIRQRLWSDNGEKDDEKDKYETCLMDQASSKVRSESSYFSDENSSIDDFALDSEYDKLCKMSLKIFTKNKGLKAIRNSLENELTELKEKLSKLEKNKGVDLECTKCQILKIDNKKLKT